VEIFREGSFLPLALQEEDQDPDLLGGERPGNSVVQDSVEIQREPGKIQMGTVGWHGGNLRS
jgi:hypothetical protein